MSLLASLNIIINISWVSHLKEDGEENKKEGEVQICECSYFKNI